MAPVSPYVMALCSPRTRTVFDAEGRVQRDIVDANIAQYCDVIQRAADEHGARLIVFPQFALTGYAPLGSHSWTEGSFAVSGPEIETIGRAAQKAGAYVVVQISETHPAFPGRNFLSAVLVTPEGTVGIIHRKNYSMSLRTSPIDVSDRFVEAFGADAFFPVLETPLGTMGIAIGAEVHWPEPVRALALKGAEIVINPIAAAPLIDYMKRPGAQLTRPVRAFENMVYLGMANVATAGAPPSQAYDYQGGAIGRTVGDDGLFTLADIDIEALRAARCAPTANLLAQIQPAIHENLGSLPLWPANGFPDAPPSGVEDIVEMEAATWRRLHDLGRCKMPAQ